MKAKCLWMTGLSGAGKTTIAKELLRYLPNGTLLDGDVIRGTPLANQVGFSVEDRRNHIKRMGHIAKLISETGVAVCSFISPEAETRDYVRSLFNEGEFVEIHVATSLEECEARDIKGLYKKARAGEIKDFTGIDAPFDVPENPEMRIETKDRTVEECVHEILEKIEYYGERSCFFIGRWNGTFHNGHLNIIEQKLNEGKNVIMAVRDVKPDEKNPWTAKEVKEMLDYFWNGDKRVKVIIIPDVLSVEYGRGVGYGVNEIKVTEKIAGISGTECRQMIAEGNTHWKEFVPERIAEFLENKSK